MKKNLIYALMSAIAFVGTAGITACSSSDEVVDNPNYDPETNSVKTQLTISLPDYVGKSATRQTAEIVQASNSFRGMDNVWLIAFESEVQDASTVSPFHNSIHKLPDITVFDKSTQNAKVYNNLDIPVETGAFMFYGKAIDDSGDPFQTGVLNAPSNFSGSASSYNFYLQPIYGSGDVPEKATNILNYLKSIRSVAVNDATLHAYLTSFKPISGSSASVQAAVQNLYNNVKNSSAAEGDKTAIYNAIKGSAPYASIENDIVTFTNDNIMGYPANIGLPDGAAVINWQDPANPSIQLSAFGSMDITALNKYVYPPSLYYRTYSSIGVSSNTNVSESYNNSAWTDIQKSEELYKWGNKVGPDTRSIALYNQIQYAVGRLDLRIKAGAEKLKDSKGNEVTVPTEGFPVSAVLVGGQSSVGYNFEPLGKGDNVIYDKVVNMSAKAGDFSGVNYTLVMETLTAQKFIYIAVELTNKSGVQFQGKDGFVPINGKFYLIGKVILDEGKDDNNQKREKIFEQDYITRVDFTIDKNENGGDDSGLGAAYNVIPDLKDAELEVAFSVNLEWIPGLTFNVVI